METAFKHKPQKAKATYSCSSFHMAPAGVITWVLNSCQSYFTPNSLVYMLAWTFN